VVKEGSFLNKNLNLIDGKKMVLTMIQRRRLQYDLKGTLIGLLQSCDYWRLPNFAAFESKVLLFVKQYLTRLQYGSLVLSREAMVL
jgi:hypothetical protein